MKEHDANLMDWSEVEEKLKMNRRALKWLVSSRQIPFIRIGKRRVRFQRAALEEYLRSRVNVPGE